MSQLLRSLFAVVSTVWAVLSTPGCASTVLPKPEYRLLAGGAFPFADWEALLQRHVSEEGRVAYAAIDRRDVETLYARIAGSSPANRPEQYPSDSARKAYYLNTYNVLVWKGVLDHLTETFSVGQSKAQFFYLTKYMIGGESLSLYTLENDIVRARFKDPRVHMALNCASVGCPRLSRTAYVPDRVEEQLEQDARRFVAEPRNVQYLPDTGRVRLSAIFDWYQADFGGSHAGVLSWINRYRDAAQQIPLSAQVDVIPYDWSLNRQPASR